MRIKLKEECFLEWMMDSGGATRPIDRSREDLVGAKSVCWSTLERPPEAKDTLLLCPR